MNVLIIPEDFRKDQYIVGPIIRRMCDGLGKPLDIAIHKPLM